MWSWIGTGLGVGLAGAAAAYLLIAIVAVAVFARRRLPAPSAPLPAVSVLKPLYGAEPRLYDNLKSFCAQDYPAPYELVCGVRDADDPAIAVVRRLQAQYPALTIRLVIDPRLHGANYKVSNLINILADCRHAYLVLADSDIQASHDYLRRVVAPLLDPQVGIVTCLYHGRPGGSRWARLGALFIDDWFAPSVLVSHLFGSRAFAFGATIALRRSVLTAIGGFQAFANELADDWWLGELTRRQGLRTVLADCVVGTDVLEADGAALSSHELRWLRTIRALQPLGYSFTFMSFGVPTAAFGVLLADRAMAAWTALGITALCRVVLHLQQRHANDKHLFSELWLLPARDLLLSGLWVASFASRRVRWHRQSLLAQRNEASRETV